MKGGYTYKYITNPVCFSYFIMWWMDFLIYWNSNSMDDRFDVLSDGCTIFYFFLIKMVCTIQKYWIDYFRNYNRWQLFIIYFAGNGRNDLVYVVD